MLTCPHCQSKAVILNEDSTGGMDTYTASASCEDCNATWMVEYEVEFFEVRHWEVSKPLL